MWKYSYEIAKQVSLSISKYRSQIVWQRILCTLYIHMVSLRLSVSTFELNILMRYRSQCYLFCVHVSIRISNFSRTASNSPCTRQRALKDCPAYLSTKVFRSDFPTLSNGEADFVRRTLPRHPTITIIRPTWLAPTPLVDSHSPPPCACLQVSHRPCQRFIRQSAMVSRCCY